VQEASFVNCLQNSEDLVPEHERGLQREPAVTDLEKVLKGGPEQLADHVLEAVLLVVAFANDADDALASAYLVQYCCLVGQSGKLSVLLLTFYSDAFSFVSV
jgi:hypothetical protein